MVKHEKQNQGIVSNSNFFVMKYNIIHLYCVVQAAAINLCSLCCMIQRREYFMFKDSEDKVNNVFV